MPQPAAKVAHLFTFMAFAVRTIHGSMSRPIQQKILEISSNF